MSRKVFIVVEAPEAVAVVIGDFHKGAEGSGTSVTGGRFFRYNRRTVPLLHDGLQPASCRREQRRQSRRKGHRADPAADHGDPKRIGRRMAQKGQSLFAPTVENKYDIDITALNPT